MGKKQMLIVDGKAITKDELVPRFNEYNRLYFNGELGKCKFFWLVCNKGTFGKYSYADTKNGRVSRIGVARNVPWTEENLKRLLVHEMIHMYVATVEGKPYDGVLGHGRRFRAHCRRLKRDFGLVITILADYNCLQKEMKPKLWEKVLQWLIDR